MNMQDKDILKAVSNAFNSSKSFEEFAMKLDLENIPIEGVGHGTV